MKSILKAILLSFAVASFALAACHSATENKSATNADSTNRPLAAGEKVVYQCPMHPNEKSDKPGKCPECGMDMEKTIVKDSVK